MRKNICLARRVDNRVIGDLISALGADYVHPPPSIVLGEVKEEIVLVTLCDLHHLDD
jgi:hypothetical protein